MSRLKLSGDMAFQASTSGWIFGLFDSLINFCPPSTLASAIEDLALLHTKD